MHGAGLLVRGQRLLLLANVASYRWLGNKMDALYGSGMVMVCGFDRGWELAIFGWKIGCGC